MLDAVPGQQMDQDGRYGANQSKEKEGIDERHGVLAHPAAAMKIFAQGKFERFGGIEKLVLRVNAAAALLVSAEELTQFLHIDWTHTFR